jgi:hypothetical protein
MMPSRCALLCAVAPGPCRSALAPVPALRCKLPRCGLGAWRGTWPQSGSSTTPHAQRGPTGPPPPPPRCGDDAAAGTAPAKAPSHADRPRDGGDRRSEARSHAAHPRAALGTTALPACPRRARWRASRRWSGCTRMCEEHGVGATRAEQRAITTGPTAALGRWQMRDDAMLAARPRGRPRALTPSLPCWRCQIQQQG